MRRERPLRCELVGGLAPRIAEGRAVPPVVDEHVGSCLRCQASVARHRRAYRHLHDQPLAVPAGALDATLDALHALPDDERWPQAWPAPSVVATAAGAAAGVAGVLALRRRFAG